MTDLKKQVRNHTQEQARKCIVPACKNFTGLPESKIFFRVPPTDCKVYQKWTRFVHLSGNRTERICIDHFCEADFIKYSRLKLKNRVVPSVKLTYCNHDIKLGRVCCVAGCRTKRRSCLEKFPVEKSVLRRWKLVLGIADSLSTAGWMICHHHFMKTDFQETISTYLKPNIVPSKKIKPLIQIQKRCFLVEERPEHLQDHNYNKYVQHSLSNRICYVAGCRSRVTASITLHKFPPWFDSRFTVWINSLRCKMMPTKNSKVCSLHFAKTCYVPGGKHLKKDAVPTLRLPYIFDHGSTCYFSSPKESIDDAEPTLLEAPVERKIEDESSIITCSTSLANINKTLDESKPINVDNKSATMSNRESKISLDIGDVSCINQTNEDLQTSSIVPDIEINADVCYNDSFVHHLNSTKYSTLNGTRGSANVPKQRIKVQS
ncbi:uncharacterized protein LOC129762787 [Toxorhynchites rutilus septentrionalis]|uniref:uncharacterized protein LOC129762787 n=1 Tax=Toxorhynchites rutilus septentrionalis TaxID=329112 RepID=UPI00247AD207|nr:uncharacterized protein LOC129762787 [Toxorhynchites rutilus septentrionalis]XP_055617303.1 uncharacterized protein LOC129762787 [Toxorhynchites rutilus septentrionalis]